MLQTSAQHVLGSLKILFGLELRPLKKLGGGRFGQSKTEHKRHQK